MLTFCNMLQKIMFFNSLKTKKFKTSNEKKITSSINNFSFKLFAQLDFKKGKPKKLSLKFMFK